MKKSVLKKEAAIQLKTSFQEFKDLKKHEKSVNQLITSKSSSPQKSKEVVMHLNEVEVS